MLDSMPNLANIDGDRLGFTVSWSLGSGHDGSRGTRPAGDPDKCIGPIPQNKQVGWRKKVALSEEETWGRSVCLGMEIAPSGAARSS